MTEVGGRQLSDERSGRGEVRSALHWAIGLDTGEYINERVD